MGEPALGSAAAATLPRLAALVRLLLQLRLMLTAIALLLLTGDELLLTTAVGVVAFALLSGMAARYWERFVPYLVNHPLLITLDVTVAAGILAIDGPSGAIFLTTVLTATICGVLFGLRGVIAVAAFQILCYALAVLSYVEVHDGATDNLLTFQVVVVHPLLYPIAGYVGLRVRDIFTELAGEQEARRQAERAAAAAEERDRLARDMHDSVAKTLRGAAMAAQALPLWLAKDPERAAATAAQIADAADIASAEARALISDLRDGSAVVPFGRAVVDIVGHWSAESGIAGEARVPDGEVRLLVTARQESIAILKEALTNVERHADATSVVVTVQAEPGHCTLTIADDGKGFDSPPDQVRAAEAEGNGHYGLLGMAERAERAGGSLDIESTPGGGTRLHLHVPTVEEADDHPAEVVR
ncbi:sensor histidine kinase [Nocardiopsis sediminis]|uniref:Sensor histidine kinase n=1 Tax=Nocardiopsis sediminis TaxID=1778267 RepID=A0ABV8FIZ3_9ACTN